MTISDPTPAELQRDIERLRQEMQTVALREGHDRGKELEQLARRVDVLAAAAITERVWNETQRRLDEQLQMLHLAAADERAVRAAADTKLEGRMTEETKERKANVRYLVGGVVSAGGAFLFELVRTVGGG